MSKNKCFESNEELRAAVLAYVADSNPTSNVSSTYGNPISTWFVNKITNFTGIFQNATSFNDTLQTWDVSQAVTMSYMVRKGKCCFAFLPFVSALSY